MQPQQRARQRLGRFAHRRSARPASRPRPRRARARGGSRSAAASARPAARSSRPARAGPPPSARSASCASTASGVFSPCARSPALAMRAPRPSARGASSSAFRSSTSGCTSARIAPVDAALAPVAHGRQPRAQLVERRQAAADAARTPAIDADDRDRRRSRRADARCTTRDGCRHASLTSATTRQTASSPSVHSSAPTSRRARSERSGVMRLAVDPVAEAAHGLDERRRRACGAAAR